MNIMEIEINEKKNNPLFNRTEVYFTIIHEGEGTPNREIIRTEIADKLNVNKENIIINNIHSSFGVQKSKGYAKVYSTPKKAESLERKYILKRNQLGGKESKKDEKKDQPSKEETKDAENLEKKEEKVEKDKIEDKQEKDEKVDDDAGKIEEKKE